MYIDASKCFFLFSSCVVYVRCVCVGAQTKIYRKIFADVLKKKTLMMTLLALIFSSLFFSLLFIIVIIIYILYFLYLCVCVVFSTQVK